MPKNTKRRKWMVDMQMVCNFAVEVEADDEEEALEAAEALDSEVLERAMAESGDNDYSALCAEEVE